MQLVSPALYPVTGPSNTIGKYTRYTRYAYYHLHLNPHIKTITTDITLSGILYFPLMFLFNAGAAVVSSIGFVSTISFSMRKSMLQFGWLNDQNF